jgi:GNAT superfamily N-acetyltransferase
MIRYARAEPSDVPSLVRMRGEEDPPDARMLAYLVGEHHPRHALGPLAMWMALDGESPVGYVAGHLTRRFECDGELQYLYVVPSHRRSGVASGLLASLAAWFAEQDARRVCVDVGSEEGRRFYRSQGATDLAPHWMVWDDVGEIPGAIPPKPA